MGCRRVRLAHGAKPGFTSLMARTLPLLQSPAKVVFAAFDVLVGDRADLGGEVISSGMRAMFFCVRIILEKLCRQQAC